VGVTPVHDAPRVDGRREDDGELLLARVRVAVAERYDGLREIGRGGMAVVYAARDRKLNRDVALKVLPPELAFRVDVRERFVREAQTAARLNHPNIVPIYAVDESDGLVYFVMALVQGESLAARLQREKRPPLRFVRQVLAQVADALAYAHRSGVVHRDIKPDNILLEHATGRAVVTDFGIARAVQSGARLTQTGIAVGTPAFMSPEQAMGQRDVDGRSDVYALGLVGYVMLAGRLPFDADTSAGMLLQHVQGTPFPLANFRPDLPFSMVDTITRAIAREPSARWPDAAALAAALRAGEVEDTRRVDEPAPLRAVVPERANAPARDSVVEALDRMNASLAYAGDQLRLGRAGALPAPVAPAAALPAGGAGSDARAAGGPMGESRADLARRVVATFHRRAKLTAWSFGIAVLGVIALGATNADPFAVPMIGGGLFGVINGLRLFRQWFRLRDVGLSVRDVVGERWRDKVAALEGVPAPPSMARSRRRDSALAALPVPERPARARAWVQSWRRRLAWTAGSVGLAIASLIMGVSTGQEPFLIPMFIGGGLAVVHGALLVRRSLQLRRLGFGLGDLYGDGWEAKVEALDDRSRAERQADELARLADADVLRSAAGRALREAVDDRLTIRETWATLDSTDRELVPDVGPTADALVDRIAALATSCARLEGAVEAHALPSLDARIAEAEAALPAEPTSDQARRLTLLRRQRASLLELTERQDGLQQQLERASLALRSLRLDVMKLRALGVGSAVRDVTTATQEARAISADIGRALDVADEVRRL
jgi:serine/threonine-protein kinase